MAAEGRESGERPARNSAVGLRYRQNTPAYIAARFQAASWRSVRSSRANAHTELRASLEVRTVKLDVLDRQEVRNTRVVVDVGPSMLDQALQAKIITVGGIISRGQAVLLAGDDGIRIANASQQGPRPICAVTQMGE